MKKILIISQDVKDEAPGIVFKKLIDELSSYFIVDVITASDVDSNFFVNINSLQKIFYTRLLRFMCKWSITIWGFDIISQLYKRVLHVNNDYDYIVSFCSTHYYFGLYLGSYIRERYNIPLFCYFVDAIPAPIGWSKNNRYYRQVKNMVCQYATSFDIFASSNPQMLEYQLKLFDVDVKKSVVLYTPCSSSQIIYYPQSVNKTILYTGSIYGPRKIDNVLEAFQMLYKQDKSILLVLVGNYRREVLDKINRLSAELRKNVQLYPYARNLEYYYKQATILLDIDADIKEDVFLSSKVVNYLRYNRPIVCETNIDSPVRKLLCGIPSVYFSSHSPVDIYKTIMNALDNCDKIDYSDRELVLSHLSVKGVVKEMMVYVKS